MKQTALHYSSAIGLTVLILMAAVSARSQDGYRAHIPFDFTIGDKTYKAGNYVIDPLSLRSANGPIAVRNANGASSHMLMVAVGADYSKVTTASLIFDRLESQYSLVAIQTPSFIVKLPRSKVTSESTLARNQVRLQTIVAATIKN